MPMPRSVLRRVRADQYMREADQFYRPTPGAAEVCVRCGEIKEEHCFESECPDGKGGFQQPKEAA